MTSEQILQSLSKLDPENKDHWTQNGQPLLSAGGEGVTRQEVIAVAPQFSRENPVLPSAQPALTDEEVKATLEEKVMEIEIQRQEAEAELAEATRIRQEAEAKAKSAAAKLEALRDEQKALDPRTDAEINRDLLKASFAERMRQAGQQAQARKLLEQAGLVSEIKALTASPVDRAIAERIIRERRNKPTLK